MKFRTEGEMAQAKCIGRYESIYDLEEACFRNYRETMQTILQTTGNITDAEWGRNHDRYRDNVIHDFDKNCGHFKKRDLVRNVRESLIERIETENLDLIKLYELRTMNQAMQESLQESKATTDKSRETVTQLKSVREEQNKTLEENNARLARLSSQQSNAREQYSNMSKELVGVEEYMAKLERQRQDQKREQYDLEEQARRNAMRLEELKKLSEQKKKSSWFKKPSWLFGSSKSDDKR
ncbi:hypothetical protein B566_EDAN008764 [Ephemera danica]|nr:hypothetical protein B566_EDAN008764 [Ephemera danica]